MGLSLVTAPTLEPVSLAEAKAHLRVLSSDEDTLIEALVKGAREQAELFTGRAFVTQTWDFTFDNFPDDDCEMISIPKPKLQSVTHVKYIDGALADQTWASSNYRVLIDGERGRIIPVYSGLYPSITTQKNAVSIRFIAGYGDVDDVPQSIKHAMLLMIGHWFEHREEVIVGTIINQIPFGVEHLLWPYRSMLA